MTSTITLTPSQNIDTLWVVRDRVRFSGYLEGTPVVVLEVQIPSGSGTPLHRHASPEFFRVLSGEVTFTTLQDGEEQRLVARAGDVLNVPSDVPHGYTNTGNAPAEVLVVIDRSMEAFFREVGTKRPGFGPPTPEELALVGAACAKHGISFVETASSTLHVA